MDKYDNEKHDGEASEGFWRRYISDDYLIKKNIATGIMLFSVIAACILLYFIFQKISLIIKCLGLVLKAIMPVIYGFAIAFVINPVMVYLERFFSGMEYSKGRLTDRTKKVIRISSTLFSVVFAVWCVYILIRLILPQTIDSIYMLVQDLPEQSVEFSNNIMEFVEKKRGHSENLDYAIEHATEYFNNWLENDFLNSITTLSKDFASGVFGMVNVVYKFLYNLIIGIIVAVYVLISKEKFAGQSKKMLYGIFKTKQANIIIHYIRRANDIFVGFIIGKLIDSAIIGVLCFVITSIFSIPYAMLISFIIGITNIIPVFGPFIGAIPSCILVLIVSPMQALYLAVIILILQQLDGNIIGPHILGDSIGISAFWVLFSILLFGSLMGVPGMIIGVPSFALFYAIVKDIIESILARKHLNKDTKTYIQLDYIDVSEDEEDTVNVEYHQLAKQTFPSFKLPFIRKKKK